ncbi:hypothetical protein CKF46_37935, partial [Klebsiella pneumoniae]
LASGKYGRAAAAPFRSTGQPNAMGGREVGGRGDGCWPAGSMAARLRPLFARPVNPTPWAAAKSAGVAT